MSILTKYRPETFEDVIGHETICKSLASVVEKRSAPAFLFVGPSGTGKTTLARIVARELGCEDVELQEIDAATNTGVDFWKSTLPQFMHRPFVGSCKFVIIDEAHMLSKSSWNALLKSIEDPPPHLFFAFCTTEGNKVPKTIQTRSVVSKLERVSGKVIEDLLADVADQEGWKLKEDILWSVAKFAEGSPRKALSGLATVSGVKTLKEAKELLSVIEEGDAEIIEICRAMSKSMPSWSFLMDKLSKLPKNPEAVRVVICAYFCSIVLKSRSVNQYHAEVLDTFRESYGNEPTMAPLLADLASLYE